MARMSNAKTNAYGAVITDNKDITDAPQLVKKI